MGSKFSRRPRVAPPPPICKKPPNEVREPPQTPPRRLNATLILNYLSPTEGARRFWINMPIASSDAARWRWVGNYADLLDEATVVIEKNDPALPQAVWAVSLRSTDGTTRTIEGEALIEGDKSPKITLKPPTTNQFSSTSEIRFS